METRDSSTSQAKDYGTGTQVQTCGPFVLIGCLLLRNYKNDSISNFTNG